MNSKDNEIKALLEQIAALKADQTHMEKAKEAEVQYNDIKVKLKNAQDEIEIKTQNYQKLVDELNRQKKENEELRA